MKILTSAEFKNELSHVLQRVKQGNAANWYEAKISARFVDMGPGWLIYPTYVMPYALGIPMTLVSGLGVMWAIVRRRREGVLMLAWIVPYGFLVSCVSWPLVRYLIPLIPFFTILGACALMNIAQRLQEWLKPGTSRFIVATVCTFVFMHLFANSLAYNSLMTGDDSRINALEWINTRIPKGSTIGMMKYNWTMPPLSKWGGEKLQSKGVIEPPDSDYLLVRITSADDLEKYPVDYFIISDQQYSGYLVNADRYPDKADFLKKILEGPDFRLLQRFQKMPTVLGRYYPFLRYPQRGLDLRNIVIPPEDLGYLSPNILIFKYEPL